LTGQIAKKRDCPVKNRTSGKPIGNMHLVRLNQLRLGQRVICI